MNRTGKVAALDARAVEAAARAKTKEDELQESRAAVEQGLQDQLRQHDELRSENEILKEEADTRQQQNERLLANLRLEAARSEERLASAQADLRESELTADDLQGKLTASHGRVLELVAALAAEREDSESRTTTLRYAAGDELQRTSGELEAARHAEASASALSEMLGRAAASANAVSAEAERERDEAQDKLRAALDSYETLEGELGAARERGAALSEKVDELTVELREVVEAGGRAAAKAEEKVQVRWLVIEHTIFVD